MEAEDRSSPRFTARLVPTSVEGLDVKNPIKAEDRPRRSYLPQDLPVIHLEHGETALGRGHITHLLDGRLSRKQLVIHWDKYLGLATVQVAGVNPSYLHAKGQKEGTAISKDSGKVEVGDGVVLSLLPGLYGYTLRIEDHISVENKETVGGKRRIAELSASNAGKTIQPNDGERDVKRRRSEDIDTAPNADADTILLSSVSEAYREKVRAVREVLPGASVKGIITALVQCQNNIEQTIDMLLAGSPVVAPQDSTVILPQPPSASPLSAASPLSVALPPTAPVTPTKPDTAGLFTTPDVSPRSVEADENIAAELQRALDTAAEQEAKARRAEEEAKSQMEIIKMLVQEKESMEMRSKELASIKMELDKLYLPGEREALEGTEMRTFTLMPSRGFENDASEMHYRTAESQFHRLCEGMTGVKVTKVEYVVNPPLVKAFERKRFQLAEHVEWEDTKPILAFHGTAEENIAKICKHNFDFSKIGASTGNLGFYGKGVYFSEYASYSIPYVRGGTKLLLCKVLVGNSFRMDRVETGKPQVEGYDSHISPCGRELVIFDPDQILPTYIIHYTMGGATTTRAMGFGGFGY